ncbi:hypothetical protein MKX01_040855 [Papaver californicum]|nr:hypothetical protein MKX01_040855 [Papaver californicum]
MAPAYDDMGRDHRAFQFYDGDYNTTSASSSNHSEGSQAFSYSAWLQSYRKSMAMYTSVTPPTVGFLAGSSLGICSSFLSTSARRRSSFQSSEQSLVKPFISISSLDKEGIQPPPTLASKQSSRRFSYQELPPTQECSYVQSVLNGVNVLCGVGLLSTSYAVKQGGWISLPVLFIFAGISCYTGILLKRCLDSSPGLQTYPDIGQDAFGAPGRLMIAIILYVELYCCCVEYIILMGDTLSSIFPHSLHVFTIMTTLMILPTVWLRDLTFISFRSFTSGGVIASLVVVVCLLWVGGVNQIGFHPAGTPFDLKNFPVAIGLYDFCYAGHSVFPNIYSSMKEPSQFPATLVTSICGFLMFGDAKQSQFTLNMPQKFVASRVAVWTTVINPLSKYALTITPVALSLEELLPPALIALVVSTLAVALTIPFFGFVMALIGSILTMLVAFMFPCACYLSIRRGQLSRLEIVSCILVLLMGVACSMIGSYSSIAKILQKLGS